MAKLLDKLYDHWCTLGKEEVLVFDAKHRKNLKAITHLRALFDDFSEAADLGVRAADLVPFAASFAAGRDDAGNKTFAEMIRDGANVADLYLHHQKTSAIFAVVDGSLRKARGKQAKLATCGIARAKPLPKKKPAAGKADALWKLAAAGDLEGVKRALDGRADPDARDRDKRTGLHHAAMERHNEIVRLLVKAGAELNATDKWNYTAYRYARDNSNHVLARWLKQRGGKI